MCVGVCVHSALDYLEGVLISGVSWRWAGLAPLDAGSFLVDSAPTYSRAGGSAGVPGASVLPHALVTAADLRYSLVTGGQPPPPAGMLFIFPRFLWYSLLFHL